jgi:hypothetical protein
VQFGRYFRTSNGGATTITNFADGSEGQVIYVRFDGNTLVNHNVSFIILAGEQPLEPESGEVKAFLYDNSIWREIGGLPNEFHHSLRMRDPIDAPFGFVVDVDSSDSNFSGTWSRHHAVNINGNTKVSIGALATGGTLSYGFIGGDMVSGDPGFAAADQWIKLFPTSMEVGIPNGALVLSDITAPGTTTNKLYSVAGALTWNGAAVQTGAAGNTFANITDGTITAAADTATDTFKLRTANSLLSIVVANDDVTHGDSVLFTVDLSQAWTFTNAVKVNDNVNINIGTGNDYQIFHNGTDTFNDNLTGILYFRQQVNGGTINFVCDDGGGVAQAVANFSAAYGLNVTTGVYKIAGTQVLGARKTGWAAATGTATRTTFDTATVTLPQLAERMKALLDDAISTGWIGT